MRKENPDGPLRYARPDKYRSNPLPARANQAADHGHTGCLAALAALLLGGLLEITVALDVADQTLFLAHLLETLDHLLNAFAGSGSYLNHKLNRPSFASQNATRTFN